VIICKYFSKRVWGGDGSALEERSNIIRNTHPFPTRLSGVIKYLKMKSDPLEYIKPVEVSDR
jgi:hypothetical protein